MFKPKRTVPAFFVHTLWPTTKRVFVVSVLSLLLLPLFFLTRGGTGVPHAYAATSDNLNFQARLETAAGAIAPDGYYNIQFKLYDADSGGTLLWTETYYDSNGGTAGNDNRVRVANGYVTVNLGSQTAFPSNMPWDQQLYLTMNVGGTTQTATPTWDGEMSPRLKLTAVPYAFNAKTASQIVSSSGANLATLSIASPTSGNQTFTIQDQGAAGTYNILTAPTGSDGYVKLQTSTPGTQQTGNLNISGAGLFGGLLQAGTLAIGSSQQFTVDASGNVATPGTIAGGSSLTLGVASTTNGTIVFKNSTNANTVTIQSAAQTGNYTLTIPVLTANDTICTVGLGNCGDGAGTGVAGGDLSGSYPNPTVARINGQTVTFTSSAANNMLVYNGSAWVNAASAGDITNSISGNTNTFTIGTGKVTSTMIFDGTIANADLSTGTYANITGTGALGAGSISSGFGAIDTGADAITTTGTITGGIVNATTSINTGSGSGTVRITSAGALQNVTADAGIITSGTIANARLTNSGALTVTAGTGLSGGGSIALGSSATLNLANTTVTAGSYGSGSQVGTFTVDAQGRLTAAANTSISIDASQITSGTINDIPRIYNKGYVPSGYSYFKLATFPIDNSGNYSSIIVRGRMGGWVNTNQASWNVMMTNRSDYTGDHVGAAVSVVGAVTDLTDIVVYKQADLSAVAYLKVKSYYTFDIEMEVLQATDSFDNTTTTPVGTEIWSLSTSPALAVSQAGNTTVGGSLTAGSTIQGSRLISTVATGTAPLQVASTTLVTNLNADLLDGQTGSYYQNASNLNAGTIGDSYLSSNVVLLNNTQTITGTKTFSALITGQAGISITGNIVGSSSLNLGTSSSTNGTIVLRNSTNANTVTIQSAAQTGNYTLSIPGLTANADICTSLGNCSPVSGSNYYIQNQNASQQSVANFWISGTGRADTGITTPLIDTATAVALNVGTTNATTINLNQNTVLAAGKSITVTGGNTASRPASPTEGMVYYDTTTKQLLTYANGKWQADRSEAVLVAASNSSDADKAAADYVGDGNTGAANDGDQVQINQALTAGAGKKVVLLAGTYTIDASISIPNNTTLSGIGQGTLITIPNALNTNFSAIVNTDTTTGTNVTLRDLKLDGNNANQSMGVGTGMAGVDFNNMGGGTGSSARQGARISGVQANNWDGLAGSNCQVGVGICLRSSSNNVLAGNTAQANAYYSFALISSSSNNTLTSNTAQGSLTDGFFVSSSNNNTLTGNTAQGNNGIGINISSSNNNTLTGNTAQGNTSYGILATSSSNNTISGNTSQGNTSYGIYITTSSSSNTVSSNTIQGNTSYGIYVSSSSTNNTLTGNSVKGNSAGIVIVSNANTVSGNTLADNGGSTANNGIYIGTSANNTIIGNTITDTSCTTTCYAINLLFAGATSNYLSGNTFTGDGTYAATIRDLGTGTIYAGQSMTQGGLDIRFKQANSSTAFNIQNANGVSVMNVDTTNGELELGNYNGGTNPVAGKIVLATTANANTVTLSSATQTTGSFTLSIPDLTANADVCTSLNNCGSLTSTSGIQNQNASAQTANFWISGTGRADTSILTPTLDTATAVALNIGTTNATSINLNQDTVLASGQSITITGGNTASRPASPTEGMVYYDTTTKQLLTYANGKWQADRSEAVLVAASNSSDADKAAADYVADGDTVAAGDGDQVEINNALSRADPASAISGARKSGKVYLFAGTYTIDASVSMPNNTTLVGAGRGTVITLPNSFNASINAVTNTTTGGNGTGVVVQNLRLDGNKANQTSGATNGIYFNGVGSGTGSSAVQGGKIVGVWSNGWYGGHGINLSSSSNNTVTGNTAQDNTTSGIYLSSSTSNTVSTNNVQGNGQYGIYLTLSSNNTLTGNTVQGNSGYGIGLFTSSASNTLTGNTVQGNGNYGIYLNASSYNTVTGNTSQGNNYGITLNAASYNTISGNKIHDNGSTNNNGIYMLNASLSNSITGNDITDTDCSVTCYAINITGAGAATNYLSNNTFTGDGTYAATIRDLGTGTIYAGQSMTQGGLDIRFKQANSTTAFNIQNANGVSVMNVDTTNGELEVGTYNGGTNPVAGKIVIATTANANTVTIASATQTGAYTLTIPALAGNATICTDNSTTACNNFIQNQTGTTQTAGFKINGAGTLGGLLTATAGATVSGAVINLNVSSNFAVNVGTGTTTAAVSIGNSANTTNLASRTINIGTVGATNVIQGVAQTTSNTTGDQLTIKGSAGLGSGNGGTLLLSGGDAGASGKMGLVSLNPTAFASSAVQSYGTGGVNNLTAGYVDTYSTIPATATISGVIMSIPDPVLNTTVGRILYVSATTTSQDFTLRLNASRTAIDINLKKNNTATLIWNGTDWTAAGASSATDLQAAYNNTQTNAGGAEIVLNSANQGAGVTIRNSGTPITGALFEVQSSIAANLFSVNNNTTEYASNGGIESGTTDWAGISTSPTQNSTLANVASGLYSLSVPITANNQGVKNTLVSTLSASTTYVVSFAVKTSAAGPYTFNTYYSVDGTANSVNCNNTLPGSGYTLTNNFSVTSNWTKISCFITTPASGMTASNAIRIYETNMGGSGTFYVDNLSVISNAAGTTPANVQIGGGATGGQPTLFTLDQFAGPPMTTDNPAYYGSMYYDTTKNAIQCYQQSSGVGTWGACGSAPDDIISMTPEYTGAVLNGTGVGTMTADFCANQTSVLTVGTLCASGEARNYYKWTSPQATPQTYGIYVTYRLPSTFKSFKSGTMSLTGLVDSTSNAAVKYAVFRKASAGTIYQCSADTTNIGTANTWTSISPTTDITSSSCAAGGANPFAAGDTMIIRITVSAQSNANAYVENLTFQYSNK